MKSTKYNISTRDGIQAVTGYTYQIGDFRIGLSKEYAPGKKGKCWYTTELTTGYRMDRRTNTTMNDALNEVRDFINSGRLAAVLPRVLADLPAGHNVNADLVPDYTIWTVHTAKTA